MSFLDNLENNLKALERQEEKDPEKVRRDQERRESERSAALRRAPHAEALRTSPFTSELLTQCRTIGHGLRVLVRFTWIGENLRLDAQSKRLELVPTEDGIIAIYSEDGVESSRVPVNPAKEDPKALVQNWLTAQNLPK
jgi:hypothetical protein